MTSYDDVVSTLQFYATGETDGGARAKQLLTTLHAASKKNAPTSASASGALIRVVRSAYEKRFNRDFETESGDEAALAGAIKRHGFNPIKEVLPKIVQDWTKLGAGKLNIHNALRAAETLLSRARLK